MRAFADGRKSHRAYLTCLLVLLGACCVASALVDGGTSAAVAGDPSALEHVIDWFSGQSDKPGVPPGEQKPKAVSVVRWEGLATEPEKPEDYQKIVAESQYPPTDAPEKLTSDQLDAIAKLAPRANKAGVQVHPAMVPLFRSMVLRYTGGTYKNSPIRFRLHTPEPYQPGKKYPMVVWLHGAGECGLDNVNQLSHLHHMIPSLVGPKKRDFFLLVPQCPRTHVAWEAPEICSTRVRANGSVECHLVDDPIALGDAPVAFTLAMIEAVMKEFPVDPNRVTVAGLSTGGKGTWRILERRPDLFAAAAPVVSWEAMHDKSLREKPLLKKIPIWAIYSSDDNGIDFARREFERMRDRGCRVFKTEFGVCGHRAWTPAMLQGDIFGWLISRAKDGERYYAAERSPTDPEKIGIFADVTVGDLKRQPTKAAARPKPSIQAEEEPRIQVGQKQPVVSDAPKSKEIFELERAERDRIAQKKKLERETIMPPPSPTAAIRGRLVESYPGHANAVAIDQLRLELVARCLAANDVKKALAVADKVKDRRLLVRYLLQRNFQPEVLDYLDREIDRIEQQGIEMSSVPQPRRVTDPEVFLPKRESLQPIPADKKSPKDECGKEWAMSSTNQYGLFPNGWEQESARVPAYVLNETGRQLRDRLAKAFAENDLAAMKELCETFIRLDDIPLASPWFDTSGGRLQGRIKYALNDKAKPVVELLREIAGVKAESKAEFVELAKKSLERIDAITKPKTKE